MPARQVQVVNDSVTLNETRLIRTQDKQTLVKLMSGPPILVYISRKCQISSSIISFTLLLRNQERCQSRDSVIPNNLRKINFSWSPSSNDLKIIFYLYILNLSIHLIGEHQLFLRHIVPVISQC